ncbi:unnamed protein product [Pieris macdunnoughi]|uniref:Odorant receptor n=1 Tax=Pieris macdunnoughi TaxID=345717 RepID=A0A821TWQ3_9NEOP|nr:unnamed protein product [Pieris macdunnoughi]
MLTKLEDPLHPLLGPTLKGLGAWGMWQAERGIKKVFYNIVHILATLFVISQYVELWFIRSKLDLALRNLSISMLSTVCVVKAGTFVYWQNDWRNVINFVSLTELSQSKDKSTKHISREYRKYSRLVTYFYWSLVAATVFTVILAPLVSFLSSPMYRERIINGSAPYPEIMSSWAPFDKSRGLGYVIMVIEHTLICFYGGGIVATYDSNSVALMTFFSGQLEILKVKCNMLFGDGMNVVSYEEAVSNIKKCHYHHINLVKYSKLLDSLLSPVMFLYVIICSLMICASAVQLTTEGTTTVQRIWIAEYLMALIAQLFLYCWHSNTVLYRSLKLDDGVYGSAWWSHGVKIRRCVLLLGGQLNKTIVFTAGPFTRLTLSTFVTILKGSYSYYTLLNSKED